MRGGPYLLFAKDLADVGHVNPDAHHDAGLLFRCSNHLAHDRHVYRRQEKIRFVAVDSGSAEVNSLLPLDEDKESWRIRCGCAGSRFCPERKYEARYSGLFRSAEIQRGNLVRNTCSELYQMFFGFAASLDLACHFSRRPLLFKTQGNAKRARTRTQSGFLGRNRQ